MLNPIRTIKTVRCLLFIFTALISVIDSREQIPLLNSYPSAKATVYLDFDGQYVDGTIWNENGPIQASPAELSSENITEIFNRIADDFRIFNLSITTDSTAYYNAPVSQRVRIIFTKANNWYEKAVGGVSFTGSFTWGDDTPAWVFTEVLGNNPKYIAACASHEIGHTLGLQHQSLYDDNCWKITEYDGGVGNAETGWAPIMGVGYYKNCTVWNTGQSAVGCDSIQSDLQVIAGSPNNFGFRTDDYGDNYTNASLIQVYDQHFSTKGMINSSNDKDVFSLNIGSRSEVVLHTFIESTEYQLKSLNEHLKISLLDAKGSPIAICSGLKFLNEGIDIIADPGTYYLTVEESGCDLPSGKRNLLFYALSGILIDADNLKRSAWLTEPAGHSQSISGIQESDKTESQSFH